MARPRLAAALAVPLIAAALPAWGAETTTEDGPVSTSAPAPAAAKPDPAAGVETLEVDRQIRDYLDQGGPEPAGPRKPHGEVSVGIGTGGYRSVYARTELPVGKTGTVSIAIGESRGRGLWYGPGPVVAPLAGSGEAACQPSWGAGMRPIGCERPVEP